MQEYAIREIKVPLSDLEKIDGRLAARATPLVRAKQIGVNNPPGDYLEVAVGGIGFRFQGCAFNALDILLGKKPEGGAIAVSNQQVNLLRDRIEEAVLKLEECDLTRRKASFILNVSGYQLLSQQRHLHRTYVNAPATGTLALASQ